jgi:Rrf2 family protein
LDVPVQISAKADYAVRALAELAAAGGTGYVTVDTLAARQGLPAKFLETIFTELRKDGVVISRRGVDGGYRLARPAKEIAVADVIRAVDGPLAAVRGLRPEDTEYEGAAVALPTVWIALRAAVREVLENVSLADLVAGHMPAKVERLTTAPRAWHRR